MTKKKNPFKLNKHEIIWNIINSLIAGALVFGGSFVTGKLTLEGIMAGGAAAIIAAVIKFQKYWQSQEGEYKGRGKVQALLGNLFKFI
jgi:hypothetical protein